MEQRKFLFLTGLFVTISGMRHSVSPLILVMFMLLVGCFNRSKEVTPPATESQVVSSKKNLPTKVVDPADEVLLSLVKVLSQADSVHREAWWVLTEDRRPLGKSPFGKAERGLLTALNRKLANKSLFRCDRYVTKRDVMSPSGYPQTVDIFEKCSDKAVAKKIATLRVPQKGEMYLMFYPDNLQEVLGLGASILNKAIECNFKNNAEFQLTELKCKNWAQDRTSEQLIRLDTYDYVREGKNLIKLRGKVYENLMEKRKISADVPLDGKIIVSEVELYAPEEPVAPPITPGPLAPAASGVVGAPIPPPRPEILGGPGQASGPVADPNSVQGAEGAGGVQPLDPNLDPDVISQRLHQQLIDQGIPPEEAEIMMQGPLTEDAVAAPPAPAEGQEVPVQVEPLPMAPQGEVIQHNENEGEYHAR